MAAEHDVDLVVRDAFFAGTADGVLVGGRRRAGWVLNVMRGLSLDRYRPKIVILEPVFNDPSTSLS